jgi:AcrR family transcriptional regulator
MMGNNSGSDKSESCLIGRGRNAAATRQAILDAARTCFGHEGYDQVGVRDIAAIAGIDPALVNRYFGSKEGLFEEAISAKFDLSALFEGDRGSLGERLTRYLLQKKAPGNHDPLVMLLRSTSNDGARRMLQDALDKGFVEPLSARMDGPDARQRAELIGSIFLGLMVYRSIVGQTSSENAEELCHVVAPVVQQLIDDEI